MPFPSILSRQLFRTADISIKKESYLLKGNVSLNDLLSVVEVRTPDIKFVGVFVVVSRFADTP